IETLTQQMRQQIPQLLETGYYLDRRTVEEREQRNIFAAAWAEVDAAIAPFLGEWLALEESLAIFPTSTRGKACIIDNYLEGSKFYLGHVVNGKVYTDRYTVLTVDGDFLGSTSVYNNEANLYAYAHPHPLINPEVAAFHIDSVPSTFAENYPDVMQPFQAAGCLTDLPE
ncbi:MAG: hypothetical protein F6K42_25905, partial [Leptolyngbya sp. SIO1D8]|nr:hypothetical protein [Leptolyngbya sp. SIO1D8]